MMDNAKNLAIPSKRTPKMIDQFYMIMSIGNAGVLHKAELRNRRLGIRAPQGAPKHKKAEKFSRLFW